MNPERDPASRREEERTDGSGVVVVCGHVASGDLPLLYGERSESDDPVDSGWQFLCNSGLEERVEDAKIWSVNDIIRHEPSLKDLVDLPPGTVVWREDVGSAWETDFDESVK